MRKISLYELLGLIKDNKAPKKIKFNGDIYDYVSYKTYKDLKNNNLLEDVYIFEQLNDEVEIIEEDKEIEKIKSNGTVFYSEYIEAWIDKVDTEAYCEYLMNKINELIDEVNKLKKGE